MSSKPSIRELRAICHGAGVTTSGMERAELEAAAEEVQARGTFFDNGNVINAQDYPPNQQQAEEEATEEAVEESLDPLAAATENAEEEATEEAASLSHGGEDNENLIDLVSPDKPKATDNTRNGDDLDDKEKEIKDSDDLDAEDEGTEGNEGVTLNAEPEESEGVVLDDTDEKELENPIDPALNIEQDTSGITKGSGTGEGDAFRSEENPPNNEAFADLLAEELRNSLRSENEKLRKERDTLSSELDATKTTLADKERELVASKAANETLSSELVASKAAKDSLSNQLASYEATKTALSEVGHKRDGDHVVTTSGKKKASRVAFWAIGVALLAIVISISNGFLAHPIVKQVLDHPIVVEVLDHPIVKDGTTKLSDAKNTVFEHPSIKQAATSFHGWAFGRHEEVKDETTKGAAVERRSVATKSLYGWAFGRHEEGAGKE